MSVEDFINQFYSKKLYLSYSGLNRLLFSPALYYKHYILQQKEDKLDNHLVEGKIVHCLLLEEGKFDKHFIVSPNKLPEGNSKLVIDRVYTIYRIQKEAGVDFREELEDYSPEILGILESMNLHQSLKTDPQRIEKIITEQTISYWNFLKQKGSRDVVDTETLEYCKKKVEVVRSHSVIYDLLGLNKKQTNTFKVYNEVPLKMDLEDCPIGIKGIVDNLVVDAVSKQIFINDVKTSGKSVADFPESLEYYKYWMQAAIYYKLVKEFLKDHIDETWTIKFNFIVIDNHNQVYPFEVSDTTMIDWNDRMEECFQEAVWHYESRDYSLPHKFATGQIKL